MPRPASLPLTQWWAPSLLHHLPLPKQLADKAVTQLAALQTTKDVFDDFYHPSSLTVLSELFQFSELSHSVRDHMPNFTTDFSPFSARTRLGKKREEMSTSKTNLATKNPSVAGNSTADTTATDDDSDEVSQTSELEDEEEVTEMDNTGPAAQVKSEPFL